MNSATAPRFHRLTRAQLGRTASALLGVSVEADLWLPVDPAQAGFDNTEAGLFVPPDFMAAWYGAVHEGVARAVDPGDRIRRWSAEQVAAVVTIAEPGAPGVVDGYASISGHGLPFEMPTAGHIELTLDLGQTIEDLPFLHVLVDGLPLSLASEVTDDGIRLTSPAYLLREGRHEVAIQGFVLGGAQVRHLEVRLQGSAPNPVSAALLGVCAEAADPVTCADDVLRPFARRAWRRPVDDAELDALADVVAAASAMGEDAPSALGAALEAVLMSPSFLFRTEPAAAALDAHALATRLAYALWSSGPDEELLDLAEAGELSDPTVLAEQVRRMLASEHRDGFITDFVGQWLGVRETELGRFSLDLAPDHDPQLLWAAMQRETTSLTRRMLDGEITFDELFTTPTSTVVAPLSDHYGVAEGDVDMASRGRVGVLGHASWLTATSRGTETSLVHRGEAVLGGLLCVGVGSPPASVDTTVPEGAPQDVSAARLSNPECAYCHTQLDPYGLALEPFDAFGAWRDSYPDGTAVKASTVLADGTEVDGPVELGLALASDRRLSACFVQKMSIWMSGRTLSPDHPWIADSLEAFEASGLDVPTLLEAMVTHDAFQRPAEAM